MQQGILLVYILSNSVGRFSTNPRHFPNQVAPLDGELTETPRGVVKMSIVPLPSVEPLCVDGWITLIGLISPVHKLLGNFRATCSLLGNFSSTGPSRAGPGPRVWSKRGPPALKAPKNFLGHAIFLLDHALKLLLGGHALLYTVGNTIFDEKALLISASGPAGLETFLEEN